WACIGDDETSRVRRPPYQLVPGTIGSLKSWIDFGDVRVDDSEARCRPPIPGGGDLELSFIAVSGRTGQVGKAPQEIRRSAVDERNEIRKPLVEVADTQ